MPQSVQEGCQTRPFVRRGVLRSRFMFNNSAMTNYEQLGLFYLGQAL